MAPEVPYKVLNDGTKIPCIGMGCWMGSPGGGVLVHEMCRKALKNGYRHFDTAAGYSNEEHVGAAIRESGIPREEIFITTKLPQECHDSVQESFERSLKNLDCGYIDLYLMHWPQAYKDGVFHRKTIGPDEHPTFIDTWKDMEKLLLTGKVKSIGVSNFSIKTLTRLLPHCTVVPATNQVELQPCLPQEDLVAFCAEKGIVLTAYSPLGQGNGLVDEPVIKSIAEKSNATPGQVLLAWGVQRGTVVIPKSANEQRMIDNITLITLSDEDMATLNALHKKPGMHKSFLWYHVDGGVFGWTYEQLGWNLTKGAIVPS
ncbi:hypothetical protein PLICRDRAFT_97506 [Plicaturopsis crispa FD-325 SS-3]|nr:hypothetical protein PLICRDRAFT_97506 [Plicaturopsis crispa FD-325 SS-3]